MKSPAYLEFFATWYVNCRADFYFVTADFALHFKRNTQDVCRGILEIKFDNPRRTEIIIAGYRIARAVNLPLVVNFGAFLLDFSDELVHAIFFFVCDNVADQRAVIACTGDFCLYLVNRAVGENYLIHFVV